MRLFAGVPISEEIKAAVKPVYLGLSRISGQFSFVSIENLHFTLKYLGDIENADEIIKLLQQIQFESFYITVKGLGYFGNPPQVIWIGSENKELEQLAGLVREKLADFGTEEGLYQPHATVARVKRLKDKTGLVNAISKFSNRKFGEMKVDQFFLYKSKLTSKGPIYAVIRKFTAQNKQLLNS